MIDDLAKESDPKMKLYRGLALVAYSIRQEVLEDSYQQWSKKCSSREKFNDIKCQNSFFEIDILRLVADNLAMASQRKAMSRPFSSYKDNLQYFIGRYHEKG